MPQAHSHRRQEAVSEKGNVRLWGDLFPAPPLKVAGSGTVRTFPDCSLSPFREVRSSLSPLSQSAPPAKPLLPCTFNGWEQRAAAEGSLLKKSHRFFELHSAPGEPQQRERAPPELSSPAPPTPLFAERFCYETECVHCFEDQGPRWDLLCCHLQTVGWVLPGARS